MAQYQLHVYLNLSPGNLVAAYRRRFCRLSSPSGFTLLPSMSTCCDLCEVFKLKSAGGDTSHQGFRFEIGHHFENLQ